MALLNKMLSTRSKEDWQITKTCIKDRFQELLCLSQWTDCTFLVGDENTEIIKCHKLILAASSPVFEALFYGGLSKPNEVIQVTDIQPFIFKQFLKYIYSDSLDIKSVEDAGDLLYVAKKYLMPQLAKTCLNYLYGVAGIKTLYDILLIAETLNEEELLRTCLKVMSRYPSEIWYSEKEHLSRNALSKYLDEEVMNMREIELWKFVLRWSYKECEIVNVIPSCENIRRILDSMDIIKKIRFLTLNLDDFEVVKKCGILTNDECDVLEALIDNPKNLSDINFSIKRSPRKEVKPIHLRCHREPYINPSRLITYSGLIKTHLTSQSRVLITGIEIVTRSSDINYPCGLYIAGNFYREKITGCIKDDNNKIIAEVKHDSNVEFNSFQTLLLDTPVWLEANVRYSLQFTFLSGVYPLRFCTSVAESKGTIFEFDKFMRTKDQAVFGSFITAVLYSI